MSKRFDPVRVRKDKGETTAQGFFKVPATFTRTGVFTYLDKDGNARRELRHPDDVFNPESIASLQMAPLTFKHPEEFVDVDNLKDHATGWVGDSIENDGKYVKGLVLITDKNAIAEVQKGTVELSCGYTADMIDEAGEYEGMPYDCRQTNIRYNHVAQVEAGRAGPLVRLHLDADDRVQVPTTGKETQVEKITINGKEFEVPAEVAARIKELEAGDESMDSKLEAKDAEVAEKAKEADEAKEEAAEEKKKADRLQAKVDSLEAKMKEKKDAAPKAEDISRAVKSRMKIEKVAETVLGKDFKEDASDLDLKKAVVAKKSGVKLDGKSEEYVNAAFDIVADEAAQRKDNQDDLSRRFSAPRTDADYDVKSARENQTKDASESWKQPLAASKK